MKKPIQILLCFSFLFLVISSVTPVKAQTSTAKNSLSGKVVDSASKEPIPFAMVLLLNPKDSLLKTGVTTNEKGAFEFEGIGGKWLLKVRMMGYKDLYIPISVETNKPTDLGEVILKTAVKELASVTILARKPIIVSTPGGYKVEVENNPIINKNQTALEVLNAIPGVIASGSGIVVVGKGGLMLQVNGLDKKMDASQLANFLSTISGDNIKQVEVIRTPSASFGSEVGSVINIITKHTLREGYFGTIKASAGPAGKYSESLNFNIVKKKLSFDMSISDQSRKSFSHSVTMFQYPASQTPSDVYTQTTDTPNTLFRSISGSASLNYKPNDYQIFGASIDCWGYLQSYINTNMIFSNAIVPLMPNFSMIQDTKSNLGRGSVDLYSKTTFKNKHELLLQFNNSFLNIDNAYTNNRTTPVNNVPQILNNQQTYLSYERAYTFKAVYTMVLSKALTIETGTEYVYAYLNDHFKDKPLPPSDATTQEVTNYFNYNENVAAAFMDLKVSHKKWSYAFGLRDEYMTFNDLSREKLKSDYRNKGWDNKIYPAISVSNNISETQMISLGFKQYLERPGFKFYNPFQYLYTPIMIVKGNPDLKPSMSTGVDLTYIWQPNQAQTYMLIGGIEYTEKFMNPLYTIDPATNNMIATRSNVGDLQHLYLYLSTQNNFTNKFSLQTSITIFKDTYKRIPDALKSLSPNQPGISLSINGNIKLPWKINSVFVYNYSYVSVTTQAIKSSSHWVNFVFDRSFLKNKLSASMVLTNPFHRMNSSTDFTTATMISRSRYISEAAVFKLGLSYKFGKAKNTTIQKQSTIFNSRM